MSDSHVTQCPHCRTSFRVSQAQLSAAQGAVRCGACLHVYNAAQQIFGSARPAQPNNSAAVSPAARAVTAASVISPPAKTVPPASDTLWIHDDLDLDSLDLDGELERMLELEQQQAAPKAAAHNANVAPLAGEPMSDALSAVRDEPLFEFISEEPLNAASLEPEPDEVDPVAELPSHTQEPELGALSDDHDELLVNLRDEPNLGREPLFKLDDEPLQLDDWQPKPRTNWARIMGWSLLNLLAIGALSGQYISYNFDELARQEAARPWFELACPTLGCALPEKVDISQIRSSNLVVRSHPQFSSALVVDAILYNRAPFAQPFPLLEIRFADIAGQLIASRRFKPSEYLAGELAGQTLMPPQTPIHIALDILDPGPRALNYSLNFHSPQ